MKRIWMTAVLCLFVVQSIPFGWAEETEFGVAPPFTLRDVKGKEIRLSDFKSQVIYLDFWGTWCPPCVEETPHLNALYQEYTDQGFVVMGVALGDTKKTLERYVDKMKVTYPVALGDTQIVQDYKGIIFLPTAFLIDRKGMIRRKLFGYKEKEEIEQLVLPLLEEKTE